ncbi:MAG TPA: DUF4139 domain-containing protein [Bryobacteraceae bacterium]|nr:DUF4139 domain-containing protein [Bryobacteraceae bacterium]
MRTLLLAVPLLAAALSAQTQLTIYNQNFAAVKETRALDLTKGENEIRVTDITAHLEPESVILRDLRLPDSIRILEQNYESDPLSEGLLLRKSEGKVLEFEVAEPNGPPRIVKGRILRSGYVPHTAAFQQYGAQYQYAQQIFANPEGGGQPIVVVDGKIQFGLPGKPIFDSLDPKAFLKPTLLWRLWSGDAGQHHVEFSYLTGGMRWEANYNAVAAEKGDRFDIVGWVTLENMSGKDFENASVKLMAGDVARAPNGNPAMAVFVSDGANLLDARGGPAVTEKSFEEYHLYTLERPTTVLDREVKQVEFVRANGVPAERMYVYDGLKIDQRYRNWDSATIRNQADYGTESNPKVWVMLEFKNSEKSHLGMPLPKGKVKVYRRDSDGRNEFVGEDAVDHTPKDETVRLYTGNAFDIVGERRQTNFKVDNNHHSADESFEIKVRNHKTEPVQVRVVEHLYRWFQWDITDKSLEYAKKDARTVEFRPTIEPGGEAVIHYTVHYTW